MKKLKRTKSLLAILLTLCICATLPIATVFAEDENDSVDVMDLPGGGSITVALKSMVDLEKTKYYKFANSDNNSLIEIENISEALLKIVGNKAENKAVMTLVDEESAGSSYSLQFMRTQYITIRDIILIVS